MDRANFNLKRSRETITHRDLINAYNDFLHVLRAKRDQSPPATPKELTRIYNKLMSTCLRLSHFDNFTPTQQVAYIHDAEKFAKRALDNASKSQSNDRVVQMEFYLTCVKAREIQLRSTVAHFERPTVSERDAAVEAISVAWATLGSLENLDMSVYDAMAKETISQLK
jgi:hypothetical protein